MNQKIGKLLMALVLVTTALASIPLSAKPLPSCRPPACFIGPGCCVDADCASFCSWFSPGSVPHCGDPTGGCCSCEVVE